MPAPPLIDAGGSDRGWPTRLYRLLVRLVLRLYLAVLRLLYRLRRPRRTPTRELRILLTGTFHSHNWIRAHLGPLAASTACARVTMVTTASIPDLPKVVAVTPPRWLIASLGAVPARLLMFGVVAVRQRPDVVGGFHLLVNGLVAILLARLTGARAWYFCVGGITELRDGGVWGENPYFARLGPPDAIVERQLVDAVKHADLVITMGSGAVAELRTRGVGGRFEIVSGGVDDQPPDRNRRRDIDLILVARLVPIKQIDLFLRVVAAVRDVVPTLTAAIVGDGPLREELTRQVRELGLADAVIFAGQQHDVRPWLERARIFVLTSQSEGLALSLMEAMMAALPAVVPRVGDLADLVEDGRNGYLIGDHSTSQFVAAICRLLTEPAHYASLSRAARLSALRYSVAAATRRWDAVLGLPAGVSDAPPDQGISSRTMRPPAPPDSPLSVQK